jgi:plastocyanin
MTWAVLLVVLGLGALTFAPAVARADYSGSYGPPVDQPMMAPPADQPMEEPMMAPPPEQPMEEPIMGSEQMQPNPEAFAEPGMFVTPVEAPRAGSWIERTPAAITFRDSERKLWEDHMIWHRAVIVGLANSLPSLDQSLAELRQNQVDLGNGVRPFYGDSGADNLTALLKDHIRLGGDVLKAMKGGDADQIAAAKIPFYANADDIATFLSQANPTYWPYATVQPMVRMHLDTVLDEAAAAFRGDWAAEAAAFELGQEHALKMADALSVGIIHQFPQKFGQERAERHAWMGATRHAGYWNTWGTYSWWQGLPETQVLGETEVLVKIGSFAFDPDEIEVGPGTVVTFYNDSLKNCSIRQSDSDDETAAAGPYSRVEYPAGIPIGRVYRWTVPIDAQPGTVYHFFSGLPDHGEAGFQLGERMSGKVVVR